MLRSIPITDMKAYEILDSRGNPTIEVVVAAGNKYTGGAKVPSGASTGKYEAVEIRDGDERYYGKGVKTAVDHINTKISRELIGMNVFEQRKVDSMMCLLDGTAGKKNLGANAILGVSLAVARAAAEASGLPLYQYLGGINAHRLPVPMMNVINGGRHAENTLDFQEFMIMPVGAGCFAEGLRMCSETYKKLKEILKQKGYSTAVGDEGGFAPDLEDAVEAFSLIQEAVTAAGYIPGKDISFAIDVAANELYSDETGGYYFPGESRIKGKTIFRRSDEMMEYYKELTDQFPLISLEDGFHEDDRDGWRKLTGHFQNKIQIVGDDLFVTNPEKIREGIENSYANSVLIKLNQIGTLSETLEAVELAGRAGYHTIVSHRSGETEDSFIADLAVAVNAGQIKTGAPCRSERVAKYNRLLYIEEQLERSGIYKNPFIL